MILISYSLFGKNRIYYDPIKENYFKLEKYQISGNKIKFVLFHDNSIDLNFFSDLDIIKFNIESNDYFKNIVPRMWRFASPKFHEANYYLFRDSDSLILDKEIEILDEWIKSDFYWSVIRDSRYHLYPILAGTFGVKRQKSDQLVLILKSAKKSNNHFYDQLFLSKFLYPKIIKNLIVYTSFLGFKNENIIIIKKTLNDFIGNYANAGPIPNSFLDNKIFLNQNLCFFNFLKFRTRLILLYLKFLTFLKNERIK